MVFRFCNKVLSATFEAPTKKVTAGFNAPAIWDAITPELLNSAEIALPEMVTAVLIAPVTCAALNWPEEFKYCKRVDSAVPEKVTAVLIAPVI